MDSGGHSLLAAGYGDAGSAAGRDAGSELRLVCGYSTDADDNDPPPSQRLTLARPARMLSVRTKVRPKPSISRKSAGISWSLLCDLIR